MKVMMFTRCMGIGGTEKVILQLCEILKINGHIPIVCAAKGKGVLRLKDLGVKYYEIPDMQKKSILVLIDIIRKILYIIKNEKVDVIHTHHRMAAFYTALLLPFINVKFVNNVHNTFNDKRKLTFYAYRNAFNIVVGENVKANMINDYHLSSGRIKVIYNTIKSDFNIDEDSLIKKFKKMNYFVIGNIGRINKQKGFEYYIKAANIIKKHNLRAVFLIIGDGILRKQVERLVCDMELTDIVYFYGYSNNIQSLIRQLDLVVLSSLWEGFPLTPIETFSAGKTIVATDVPGTVEIVKNNVNGLVVPVKDEVALAGSIERFIIDDQFKRICEENAYKTYCEFFSYEVFSKEYMSVYLNV